MAVLSLANTPCRVQPAVSVYNYNTGDLVFGIPAQMRENI